MTSPANKSVKRGGKQNPEDFIPKQPWSFDPSVMVCIESAVDGHRILADRNCVATCRRLADLIPPLIPPPPPPVDPKDAVKQTKAATSKRGGKDDVGDNSIPAANRGPSEVSPLFEDDLSAQPPATSATSCRIITSSNNKNSNNDADTSQQTPIIPVIRVECLDGRQLEAAMRIAYYKYMGDTMTAAAATPEIAEAISKNRRTVALDQLGITAEELMAMGAILGC
jgi:hypothetical protein